MARYTSCFEKIEQLVSNAEEQVVRDFLIDLLKKDKNLVQRFTRLTSPEITEKVVQQLKHRIDKIVLRHAGMKIILNTTKSKNLSTI